MVLNPFSLWRFLGIAIFSGSLMPASVLSQPATQHAPFLLGADISLLARLEQRGAVYREDGQPEDAIRIFTNHGWNCFRLRLFVDPNGRGGVVNSLDYTRALAKRIKAAGAMFILDIHYSDTWADPQHQIKPHAWNNLSFDALEQKVRDYTADAIAQLQADGCLPDIVQIGNEITPGMIWPDGQLEVPPSNVKVFDGDVHPIRPNFHYDEATQWRKLTRLIQAGVAGVRDASHPNDRVRILIHIDCGGDWPTTRWFFDHLQQHKVAFDLIGQSYYPHWHGTLENVRENLRETAHRYGKDILIVETAYPTGDADHWSQKRNMAWPISPDGQAQFLAALIDTVRATPDGHGIGVLYWQPELLPPKNGNAGAGHLSAMSLFDADGNSLPAMDVLHELSQR
jgi:arabinogalactan endo-1,4-beta-galactosidase